MVESKDPVKKKKAAPAAPKARQAKQAEAPQKRAAAKPAAKKAVARPVTRVAAPKPKRAARAEAQPAPKREKPQPKPLPTAPAGHAPLVGADGAASGSVALPAALTLAEDGDTKREVPDQVVFQAYLAARANARQATAATRNRSRVRGGGAKPWRQKGTGRARQGSTRAPHWRHGAVVFGPNGRRYEQRTPQKVRRAAFARAFADLASAGRVLAYDALPNGETPRTRAVVEWLGRIGDTGRTVVVAERIEERHGRAMANLRTLALRSTGSLQLADLLRADTVLVAKGALDALALRAGEERA